MLTNSLPGHVPSPSSSTGLLHVAVDDVIPAVRACVTIAGELDFGTTPTLATHLDSVVRSGYQQVDVDMGQVQFCDVTGLHLLITASAQVRDRGGRLTVLGPCPALTLLLDILGPDVGIDFAPLPRPRQHHHIR